MTTSTTTTTTTTTLPPVTSAPPPGTPCSAVNLLSNPSFASGLTGWDTTGYVYTITAYVRDGSSIAYASAPDGSISQTVPAVPGDRYEVWHYSGTHEPGSDANVRRRCWVTAR